MPSSRELPGVVALVLSIGLAGFVIVLGIGISVAGIEMTETGANVLSTVMGAMVGAVSTYLGVSARRGEKVDEPPETTDG